MPEQPNKPGGDVKPDGTPRDPADEQAVKNQSAVEPEDYPEPASGDDMGGKDR